ncbi:Hypothetical predicted protein [Mytilus galloprovincialis]|uniref:Uncharacterized protein n=1 Tax=Mytilus galloprovincialis TaxID=29158 RepID=A0A8B6CFL8_MYTGA|nr:Hypothetical predicted protein [Mytilus galloprovincialis]
MPFTDSFLDGLLTEGVDNDGHKPRRPITYDDMRSIADYASRHFGTEYEVGPSGDGMVSGSQSTVSMADMVWSDIGTIQPKSRSYYNNTDVSRTIDGSPQVTKMTDTEKNTMKNMRKEIQQQQEVRRIDELKEEVAFWQGRYLECQEQMEAFLNQREIVTFHDGRYTDIIREVYMELMCMRVGAKNVSKIIKTVMEKITGMTPQRLPGSTFAKYMLLEARSVALVHLKEEIQASEGNITVGPDGTTKFGHHYDAISISLSGKTMCMGMRDMAGGDAEAYRKLLEGIITEMTVGLSEQANKTLSLWESLVHSGEKVGAPTLPGGYSIPGESGTTRLVRTVCKAVQDRRWEKAGKPLQFRDFLHTQGQVKEVPIASFKGNRFNILFHNATGVYYLLNDLLAFAEEHKADNRLFTAVNADLSVLEFQAGARPLGILSKLVTGPMWRFMEENGHAREDSREQRQRYVERLADIRQQRQEALAMKREKKEAKGQRDREKKEELTQKIQEVGGLWKTPSKTDTQLSSLESGQRVKALQTQFTFRRYVLGTPNTGKILNVMAGGKYLSAEKLTTNLKCVIRQAEDDREERQAVHQVSGQV